jgi:hypothetical protein
LDLGIAFVLDETGITRNSMSIPGTLYYLAPEMLKPHFRSKRHNWRIFYLLIPSCILSPNYEQFNLGERYHE